MVGFFSCVMTTIHVRLTKRVHEHADQGQASLMSLICPGIKNASRSNPYLSFLAAQEVNYLKSILFLSQIHRDISGPNDTDQSEYAVIHLHDVRVVQRYQNVGA